MDKDTRQILKEFISNFPREEIVNKLNEIDSKISSLHSISSKDFMYFNKLLKQYYSSLKDIVSTNKYIADFITEDLLELKKEVETKYILQQNFFTETRSTINKISTYLLSVISKKDMIIVPFSNYKQNIITLKYILANLRLHLNYIKISNKESLKRTIFSIEDRIVYLQEVIDNIDKRTEVFNARVMSLKQVCTHDFLKRQERDDELTTLHNSYNTLSFDKYLPIEIISELNSHTDMCFSYLNAIITNIQYHDIIRQKMEHIQQSQNKLIEEINHLYQDESNQENQLNLIARIPEITDIQVAQLLYTNKDYQTSIEKITTQLIEVGNEMKSLSSAYNHIRTDTGRFEKYFVDKVESARERFSYYLDNLCVQWNNPDNEFALMKEEYDSLKNEYNDLFEKEKALRSEVKSFEEQLRQNGENFAGELISRLRELFAEIRLNSNTIKTHLNGITENVKDLVKTSSIPYPDAKKYNIDENVLSGLLKRSSDLKKKAREYVKISSGISGEITGSLKKIEYYSYFKKTVEEIVAILSSVNNLVDYSSLNSFIDNEKDYLSYFKSMYTMKSERDIYLNMFGDEKIQGGSTDSGSTFSDDEKDIELF